MNDGMKSFISALGKDQSLRSKIEGARISDAVATAKHHGHDIEAADLEALVAARSELSDDALDEVSGGVLTSFQIELPAGLLDDLIADANADAGGGTGTAANVFCLAGDAGIEGSSVCVDEEVESSSSGNVRGTSNYRG